MRPLLCIRHDATDAMTVAVGAFRDQGVAVHVLDAWDPSASWPDLDDVAGIVVFGGDQNADQVERHPHLLDERHLMRDAAHAGIPALGVCLGGQILARALDAPVRRIAVREFGFYELSLTEPGRQDPLLSAFRDGDRVFQWHEDSFELPEGAVLLATARETRNQAFRHGEAAWGIQFHPEMDADLLESWISLDPEGIARTWGSIDAVRAGAREHLATQMERGRDFFGRFARLTWSRA